MSVSTGLLERQHHYEVPKYPIIRVIGRGNVHGVEDFHLTVRICVQCSKRGHFKTVCKSVGDVRTVNVEEDNGDSDAFLGVVTKVGRTKSWPIKLLLNNCPRVLNRHWCRHYCDSTSTTEIVMSHYLLLGEFFVDQVNSHCK